jgi:AMP deaminase
MEEFSVFASVFRCSNTDLCELARNSVLQSGFEDVLKRRWLGPNFHLPGPAGNDPSRTNVPPMRLQYRLDMLTEEMDLLYSESMR